MTALFLSATALLAAFHCEADAPLSLVGEPAAPKLNSIGLPPQADKRSFDVRITQADGLPAVEVDWPSDYMRLAANVSPAFEIAEGSYAFSGFSVGPCLFTDKGCITQFSIIDRGDRNGNADLLILPAALTTDVETKKKSVLTVILRGTCQRTDLKQ